jgi:hypothetical protein
MDRRSLSFCRTANFEKAEKMMPIRQPDSFRHQALRQIIGALVAVNGN